MNKQAVDIVKVEKVGGDLKNPIWLNENDGADVEETRSSTEEWFVFHPGNDIVHAPTNVEKYGAN